MGDEGDQQADQQGDQQADGRIGATVEPGGRPADGAPDGAGRLALVTGATGYIGGRLVPELLAAGYRVRAMARHPRRLRDRPWSDARRGRRGRRGRPRRRCGRRSTASTSPTT